MKCWDDSPAIPIRFNCAMGISQEGFSLYGLISCIPQNHCSVFGQRANRCFCRAVSGEGAFLYRTVFRLLKSKAFDKPSQFFLVLIMRYPAIAKKPSNARVFETRIALEGGHGFRQNINLL